MPQFMSHRKSSTLRAVRFINSNHNITMISHHQSRYVFKIKEGYCNSTRIYQLFYWNWSRYNFSLLQQTRCQSFYTSETRPTWRHDFSEPILPEIFFSFCTAFLTFSGISICSSDSIFGDGRAKHGSRSNTEHSVKNWCNSTDCLPASILATDPRASPIFCASSNCVNPRSSRLSRIFFPSSLYTHSEFIALLICSSCA